MRILGVDFGLRKVGFAIASGSFSEPYSVFRYKSEEVLVEKLKNIILKEGVEKIVVGVSENKMAEETRRFWERMKGVLNIPIVFQDETLSTKEAQTRSLEAGLRRKKRQKMEDAYAAAIILQNYLDNSDN